MTLSVLLVVLCVVRAALCGGPYGLAEKPPMGWRSWNAYGANVNQQKLLSVIDKLTERTRTVAGKPTSLADLGYADMGLDDNWQACGAGVNNSFHDAAGNPLVNLQLFPNISQLPAYAHAKGITAGFYANNCICSESQFKDPDFIAKVYQRTVEFLVSQGWDGVKLDGCSQFHNTTLWANLMNATGRPMIVENCGNTNTPTDIRVEPYNFYRISTDINPSWNSIFGNLQASLPYRKYPPLSRPTCWAYSDMLEVGRMPTYQQSRTHFGAWCVTSNPLILGYDVLDESVTDTIWDVISNTEAIAINQAWAGHPGQLTKEWPMPSPPAPPPAFGQYAYAVPCNGSDVTERGWRYDSASMRVMGPNSICLDAVDPSMVQTLPCSSASSQKFYFNSSATSPASICSDPNQQTCMDVWGGASPEGPLVQMFPFHGGDNELFTFTADGFLHDNNKFCIASRNTKPEPEPPGPATSVVQLWTKPQPNSAMAVFFLSSQEVTNPNVTLSVDFKLLNFTTSSVKVRDVWQQKDLGVFQSSFTTDPFGAYDSRFYLFSPASSAAVLA